MHWTPNLIWPILCRACVAPHFSHVQRQNVPVLAIRRYLRTLKGAYEFLTGLELALGIRNPDYKNLYPDEVKPIITDPGVVNGDASGAGDKGETPAKEQSVDANELLTNYIKGDISSSVLKNIGGQSLVNKASRIKDAYKGEHAGRKKYKGKPISDIDTLKELKYGPPGDRYTWSDISSEIHSSGKAKSNTDKIISYLTDDYSVFDLRWQTRRNRVQKIKSKFKKSKLSLDEFKNKYPKDYKELTNLLAKAEIR